MLAILFVLGVGLISDMYTSRIYLSNVKIIQLGSSVPDRQSMNKERAEEFIGKVKGKKMLIGHQSNQCK